MDNIYSQQVWEFKLRGKLWTHVGIPISRERDSDVRKYLKKNKAWFGYWTTDFDLFEQGEWYRYICDCKPYRIENIERKKDRQHIRKCLRECCVERVDVSFIRDHCYQLYVKAAERYSNFDTVSESAFYDKMNYFCEVGGYEGWIVKYNEEIIAYSIFLDGDDHKILLIAKFSPDHSTLYPMCGMYFTAADYYLNELGLKSLVGANRTLNHETNIEEFRIRLGWRKAYSNLSLYTCWWFRFLLVLFSISRSVIFVLLPNKIARNLKSLLSVYDISRKNEKVHI